MVLGYMQDDGRPPCVSIHISLQPRLAPPTPSEQTTTGEQEDIVRGIDKWQSALLAAKHSRCGAPFLPTSRCRPLRLRVVRAAEAAAAACPPDTPNPSPIFKRLRTRLLRAMAVDMSGVGTLVCRYLATTPLPPGHALPAAGEAGDSAAVVQSMLDAARRVSLRSPRLHALLFSQPPLPPTASRSLPSHPPPARGSCNP